MWRSDRGVVGPTILRQDDVPALNRLFSDAFTDRYRRDGMHGVRVPYLNPAVWRYAIANAGDGAFVWRDGRGAPVAFNLAHRSGREGWMGPLAVRQDHQGRGLGRNIVQEGIRWLQASGATTIGLETMPRTVDNIGFYSRLGFQPGPLTITLQGDAARLGRPYGTALGSLDTEQQRSAIRSCADLVTELGGVGDYSREARLTLDLGLGDVLLDIDDSGSINGFAIWHRAALAQDRPAEDGRILKLVARDSGGALRLVRGVGDAAARIGLPGVSLRCQAEFGELYQGLIAERFQVQWTDLRMVLASHPAPVVTGVVLSNREI